MKRERLLAVNADDFGYARDVNRGILDAHRQGILTSTTLMANGHAFDDAVAIAKSYPTLDVGVHFVLVGGRSLLSGEAHFPKTVAEFVRALLARQIRVYDELRAQIQRILNAGLQPTHLDTHKHTHLMPPVLDAVARLGEEFGVRWVRRPMDMPLSGSPERVPLTTRLVSSSVQILRRRFHRVLSARGCRTTDHFAGFQLTGRFHARDLTELIRNLPVGSTEFMCHPGYCTEELQNSPTRLKTSRESELAALIDPQVRQALGEAGVRLVSYRDLD